MSHPCKARDRWLVKDEKSTRTGFLLFKKFMERAITLSNASIDYGYFVKSTYFDQFVAFGKHVNDINAIRPESFMEFLLRAKVPLSKWTVDFVYDQYVRELNKKETADAAVERTILLFQQWAQDSGHEWHNFFRVIHPNQAVNYIRSGRVSPWILYTAPSSSQLFDRMSDEQLSLIEKYVEPRFWQYKFDQESEYVDFVKNVLTEYGL